MKKSILTFLTLAILGSAVCNASAATTTTKKTNKKSTTQKTSTSKSKGVVTKGKSKVGAKNKVSSTVKTRKRVYYAPPKPKPITPPPWPPAGFKNSTNNGAWGKIATVGDMVIEAANSKGINDKYLNYCNQYVCQGVYFTSKTACTSWQIDADVVFTKPTDSTTASPLGHLITYGGATTPKQVKFYLLQSSESLTLKGMTITNVVGQCLTTPAAGTGNVYTPNQSVDRLAPGTQS